MTTLSSDQLASLLRAAKAIGEETFTLALPGGSIITINFHSPADAAAPRCPSDSPVGAAVPRCPSDFSTTTTNTP